MDKRALVLGGGGVTGAACELGLVGGLAAEGIGRRTTVVGVLRWTEQQRHEIVEVVRDHKTGKSRLWDRPNLKPWVTDPVLMSTCSHGHQRGPGR